MWKLQKDTQTSELNLGGEATVDNELKSFQNIQKGMGAPKFKSVISPQIKASCGIAPARIENEPMEVDFQWFNSCPGQLMPFVKACQEEGYNE